MKKETINNVVMTKEITQKTFSWDEDYGFYAKFLEVVTYDGKDDYVSKIYCIDETIDWHYGLYDIVYDLTLNMVEDIEMHKNKYKQKQLKKRIETSLKKKSSTMAEPGDKIKVIAGRKYPKGSVFTVKESFYYRDSHDRIQTYYWKTKEGSLVNQENCIIIE